MGEYISWSGGKDSTATIILAHELGLPPVDIVFSEVMFDKRRNISGELPKHIHFIKNIAIPQFNKWGYKVNIVHSDIDYIAAFMKKITRSKNPERNGKINGFPFGGGCQINNRCKTAPMLKYKRQTGNTAIVGIAADEIKRLERVKANGQRSLIAEHGLTETDCFCLCQKYNLLSPIYKHQQRSGCWFCPNSNIKQFAALKMDYPDLWHELHLLSCAQNKVHEGFKYGLTFDEVDKKVDKYIALEKYEQLKLDMEG